MAVGALGPDHEQILGPLGRGQVVRDGVPAESCLARERAVDDAVPGWASAATRPVNRRVSWVWPPASRISTCTGIASTPMASTATIPRISGARLSAVAASNAQAGIVKSRYRGVQSGVWVLAAKITAVGISAQDV